MKWRNGKYSNCVEAIEALVATAQKKLKKTMAIKEKVDSETYSMRRAQILELLTSEAYNP